MRDDDNTRFRERERVWRRLVARAVELWREDENLNQAIERVAKRDSLGRQLSDLYMVLTTCWPERRDPLRRLMRSPHAHA